MLSLGSSQNCQFILYNGTGTDSVVCVRMNITAEFKIGYNKTVDNTTEVYVIQVSETSYCIVYKHLWSVLMIIAVQ